MASASSSAPTAAAAATTRAPRSSAAPKLTCLCSPTNHPGSFRCSRHRNNPRVRSAPGGEAGQHRGTTRPVRALLLQKIAGPSRQRRHRGDFQPRPSRLRLMNK